MSRPSTFLSIWSSSMSGFCDFLHIRCREGMSENGSRENGAAGSPISVLQEEDTCNGENNKISEDEGLLPLELEAKNGDACLISKTMEDEEISLHAQRIGGESVKQKKQGMSHLNVKFSKLDELLMQTQLYSEFLLEKMQSQSDNHIEEDDGSTGKKSGRGRKRKANVQYKLYNTRKARTAVAAMLTRSHEDIVPGEAYLTAEERAEKEQSQLVPLMTGGKLKTYQIKGVKWLISLWQNGLNGILADQMGLGKTVQTIGFLAHLKGKGLHGPYMVIAPLSTLSNWLNEVSRFDFSAKYNEAEQEESEEKKRVECFIRPLKHCWSSAANFGCLTDCWLCYFPKSIKYVGRPACALVMQCLKVLTTCHDFQVLIFSQFTKLLDILEYYLSEKGLEICRIDGSVRLDERMRQIAEFNDLNSNVNIFLLSTRAGGLGINLTAADTCIIYDSDWNPQMDLQAMDRCHRIGQSKPVHVYRLATSHSVEGKIIKRAFGKLKLEHVVIGKGQFHQDQVTLTTLEESELLALLREEEDAEDKLTETDISDEDLLRVLDRSELCVLNVSDTEECAPAAGSLPLKGPGWEVVLPTRSGGSLLSAVSS
ncbi:ATP-dependent DNA helicase DDM1 [Apostasia shenzhenica]|uniref:ATP-dependent DNA helicase DDM1 n=1 Tax=Apostasia shenzhenica TaxID=1088818 RepID=A0A2H9ZZY4_9ASPA|nr:ATP-dependent DNA helicase DDM1 [Apostasia shenzhenica]